jgi:hypothetical protein
VAQGARRPDESLGPRVGGRRRTRHHGQLPTADEALDDLTVLLEDADRQYRTDLEQRDAAVRYVQGALLSRFGTGPDLPIKDI